MRQMPHGQWVSFEADEPHNCDKRPADTATPRIKPSIPRPAEKPAEPFTPLYPKVPETAAPGPNVIRSQPAPSPPPRGPSFGAILAWMAALVGSTVGLLFAVFGLLSLPLSVVALMHLTGWSWFGAIIGTLLFSCIPLVGQLGYVLLAIMGAYYLWAANFDWQKAVYSSPQSFSVSTLSESELERFKTDVVRLGLERACKSNALKTNGFNGKLPVRTASQCECIATNFATKLTRDDLIAYEKLGRYPEELEQRLGIELRSVCPN